MGHVGSDDNGYVHTGGHRQSKCLATASLGRAQSWAAQPCCRTALSGPSPFSSIDVLRQTLALSNLGRAQSRCREAKVVSLGACAVLLATALPPPRLRTFLPTQLITERNTSQVISHLGLQTTL